MSVRNATRTPHRTSLALALAAALCGAVAIEASAAATPTASAGSSAYGAPSVLAQLVCEVEVVRAIPRTVFRPVPNVDSVLARLQRLGAAQLDGGRAGAAPQTVSPALRALVAGGFAHRRKTLAGSLGLADGGLGRSREQVRAALLALGRPADARAERLSPEEFRALAGLLEL